MLGFQEAVDLANNKQDGGRPEFYIKAVDHKDADGNVTSRDEVYVRIYNISDPKTVIERPKRDEDEKRYAPYWKAYLENSEAPADGTPLESFPALTPADIANLKRHRIRTVEEVINLADQELQRILGGRAFATRKKAQQFIDYRQGDTSELLKRIEELEKQLGNDTSDMPERSKGNGVQSASDVSGEQQSGSKDAAADSEDSGKDAGGAASVDVSSKRGNAASRKKSKRVRTAK